MNNYWQLELNENFHEDLIKYAQNSHAIERIQYSGLWFDSDQITQLKTCLKAIYEQILSHHKNIVLRFYQFEKIDFDVDWIADLVGIESLSIEVDVQIKNIEKLAHFKHLQYLSLNFGTHSIQDLSFLSCLNPNLQVLHVCAEKKNKKADLLPIVHFKQLKRLWVMHFEKNLDQVLSQLTDLQSLWLRSISSYHHLDFIANLKKLTHLRLDLCSFSDISGVTRLSQLASLSLFKITKVENFDFITQLTKLHHIELHTVSQISVFPDIDQLQYLNHIQITSCTMLHDFSALQYAPSLKAVYISHVTSSSADDLMPILNNVVTEYIHIKCKNAKVHQEVQALLQSYGKKPYHEF